ncbi:odorant receptor 13a-like [Colletes gigas]|uniref:odorant receptor 13a-like n=1 Tax=Colletes gigas TaxID=935657 RepID=UPI001C9A8427|nr:odorant receptor 13a-like [Colletes gigas]
MANLVINIATPSNNSQHTVFLFELNYGVDTEKYFYYIIIHSYVGATIMGHLIVVCYTLYVLYAQHAFALFAIVSYQLKTIHILDANNFINLKDDNWLKKYEYVEFTPEEHKMVYEKLFFCIQEHQNALKYAKDLESLFMKSIFFQLFFNCLTLSATSVCTVRKLGNVAETIRYGSVSIAQITYIFSLCLPGQRLMNHSEDVYAATYETMWYKFSKKTVSLYKILLIRCLIPSKLTAFKMAPLTMETFLTVIRAVMSYFTVLLSANETSE